MHREQQRRSIKEGDREHVERIVEKVAVADRKRRGPIEMRENAEQHCSASVCESRYGNLFYNPFHMLSIAFLYGSALLFAMHWATILAVSRYGGEREIEQIVDRGTALERAACSGAGPWASTLRRSRSIAGPVVRGAVPVSRRHWNPAPGTIVDNWYHQGRQARHRAGLPAIVAARDRTGNVAATLSGPSSQRRLTIAMIFTAGWVPILRLLGKQNGYRGTAMVQITSRDRSAVEGRQRPSRSGREGLRDRRPRCGAYKNVQVLNRLEAPISSICVMASITQWVGPQAGLRLLPQHPTIWPTTGVYAKRVAASRMLQMTRGINTDWKTAAWRDRGRLFHLPSRQSCAGVRLVRQSRVPHAGGFTATNDGMGHPNSVNGSTGLPQDPFAPLLEEAGTIRVQRRGFRKEPARRFSRPSRPTH